MNKLQLSPPAPTIRLSDRFSGKKDTSGGNRRRFLRTETRIDATILCDTYQADCSVLDLSEGGARIRSFSAKVPPRRLSVQIPGIGTLAGQVVWRGRDQFGFKFQGTERMRSATPVFDEQGADDAYPTADPGHDSLSPSNVVTDTVSLRGNRLQQLRKLALRQAV